jgi:hypothetical protein
MPQKPPTLPDCVAIRFGSPSITLSFLGPMYQFKHSIGWLFCTMSQSALHRASKVLHYHLQITLILLRNLRENVATIIPSSESPCSILDLARGTYWSPMSRILKPARMAYDQACINDSRRSTETVNASGKHNDPRHRNTTVSQVHA